MLTYKNAPVPPREIIINGSNKEFQFVATVLDKLLEHFYLDDFAELIENDDIEVASDNIKKLIEALRGSF